MENKIEKLITWLKDKYGHDYTCNKGSKYYKIITKHKDGGATVYAFIDKHGNIYMPTSWSKPAKHVRGHITNPEVCCDRYGVKYLNNKGELI